MTILEKGIKLINLITEYGYEAYIVGGAIRDHLLGLDVNDVDITSTMPMDEVKKHFDVVDNGSKYLSLTINFLDSSFEITNFRKELLYINHRHPKVEYTLNLDDDLNRRDFTINALLLDKNNNIIDKFDGLKDLKEKRIKTIGNPNKRFNDDALRILRGLYLYAKLDFEFDNETNKAIISSKELLKELSNERLYEYFLKLVRVKNDKLLNYINNNDLFCFIKPYEKWLNVSKNDYSEYELVLAYFQKYKEYPPQINKDEKKRIVAYQDIIDNNFDKMVLYKYYKNKDELLFIFKFMGYDELKINNLFDSLIIKNDKELALTKKEISDLISPENRSIVINNVIKEILNNNLNNNKEEIKEYVLRMKI